MQLGKTLSFTQNLQEVPGRPVISNYGTHTEKVFEFLYSHLQPITWKGLSYVKDSGDFISKAGLTLNDLYDTTFIIHSRFSNVYFRLHYHTHTEFIKVVLTKYPTVKSLSKMIQEQAVAAVIIALLSEKNKSRKKRQKTSLCETFA